MKKTQYIIRKFVMAKSAKEALKKEKDEPIAEVYINPDYKGEDESKEIGFKDKK